MDGSTSIRGSAEPGDGAPSPARKPARKPPPRKRYEGHSPKIRAAVERLEARGLLPPLLRPKVRCDLILNELLALGYGADMPSEDTIERWWKRNRG